MATWKAVERKVATICGGKRTGATGGNSEDVGHNVLSIEVKHRAALPTWLTEAYQQAVRNAPADKLPVVVLHEEGSRDYLAILPLARLAELVKE